MKKLIVIIVLMLHFGDFVKVAWSQISIDKDKYDSSKPVDIVADVLTVRTKDRVAIFRGNVVSKQGDVKISANQMDVYYNDKKQNNSSLSNDNNGNSIEGVITKIRVGGNVVMTVPGKRVESDIGTYDVEKGFVILQGNVKLNNEGNLLKGEKLIYNIKKGTSRMLSSSQVSHNKNVSSGKNRKKRVKGLFIPKSKNNTR